MEVGGRRPAPWVENRPSRGWRGPDLAALVEHRDLVGFLALRDVRARYKQAVLGVAWTVLQPLAATLALVLVFRRFVDVPSDGLPYHLFALAGFAFWTYVSGTIGAVTGSLLGNPSLVTKVHFPRLVIPLAAVLPGLVDLGIATAVLAVLMAVAGHAPPLAIAALPLVVLLAVVVAVGVGLWLCTANVLYRDVGHGLPFLVQLWFFLSPVAYPSSSVAEGWRLVYALNPVAGLVDLARAVLLGAPLDGGALAVSCGSALLLLAGGLACFQRLERRFADVI